MQWYHGYMRKQISSLIINLHKNHLKKTENQTCATPKNNKKLFDLLVHINCRRRRKSRCDIHTLKSIRYASSLIILWFEKALIWWHHEDFFNLLALLRFHLKSIVFQEQAKRLFCWVLPYFNDAVFCELVLSFHKVY